MANTAERETDRHRQTETQREGGDGEGNERCEGERGMWKQRRGVAFSLSLLRNQYYRRLFLFNPFTATACNISGLKSAHIHDSKQYI